MPAIIENLLKPGPNRPGTLITPQLVIVHRTGNPGSSARQNRDYFNTVKGVYASAHYCVDGREIIRCLPETERAHHCRGANFTAIGIETCEPLTPEIYRNTLELVIDICRRRGFQPTPQYVQPHSKYDPLNRAFDPFNWDAYTKGRATPERDLYDPFPFYADLKRLFQAGGGLLG